MKILVTNLITFKIPILTAINSTLLYMKAVKIGILNMIEFVTSIFILFKFFTIPIPFFEINNLLISLVFYVQLWTQ